MKCYNHHDRDAFGINVVTGKALCLECMEEYKGMIIEKNSEFSKNAVERLLMSYKHIGSNKTSLKILSISFFICGGVIIAIGILSFFTPKIDFVSLIFGFFSLMFGLAFKKYTK